MGDYNYLMAEHMKDNGKMEYSMVKASIEIKLENGRKVNGSMVKASSDNFNFYQSFFSLFLS